MIKATDPSYNVFKDVAAWNNGMVCFPEWEEILEFEYIRQRGELNMLTQDVRRYAFDNGLLNAFSWFERCSEAKMHPAQFYSDAVEHYEKEHGSRGGWITEDVKERLVEAELSIKEEKLLQELRSIRKKRASRKV